MSASASSGIYEACASRRVVWVCMEAKDSPLSGSIGEAGAFTCFILEKWKLGVGLTSPSCAQLTLRWLHGNMLEGSVDALGKLMQLQHLCVSMGANKTLFVGLSMKRGG